MPNGTWRPSAAQRKRYNRQVVLRRQQDPKVRERFNATARRYNRKLKHEALAAYSGGKPIRCICCKEADERFLTIDHKNDDGAAHKRKLGLPKSNGRPFYQVLKNAGYPKNAPLQIACYNCNCGRRINGGVCPHTERNDIR